MRRVCGGANKPIQRWEEVLVKEVEQRPKFGRVVLQRRAREQVHVLDGEGPQVVGERGVLVLQTVRLVDHHVPARGNGRRESQA